MDSTGKLKIIDSAVLAPLYRHDRDGLRIVLIRRTDHGIHGGQIGFPGGRCEPQDRSREQTALREAEEEIGLTPDRVDIISPLPPVVTLSSRYRIHPFLARIRPPDSWRICPAEVAEILDVPIDTLAAPENHGRGRETLAGRIRRTVEVDFFRINGYRLWGATYRIVAPLLPDLLNGKWRM